MYRKPIMLIGAAAIVAGCAGSPEQEDAMSASGIPQWVVNPQSEVSEGLAATECVPASDQFSIDRNETVAQARQSLSQQIEVSVQSMEETYQQQTRTQEGETVSGSDFQSVSRQLSEETLSGSRIHRTDYVEINENNNLCSMVVVGEESMRELFDNIVAESERDVGPENEGALWQQFQREQRMDSMDDAMSERDG